MDQLAAKLDDDITDEQFEAMVAAQPKRTQEEVEADCEEFLNHPLNCKELTAKDLERPEFQALQAMAYEGEKEDVAKNFMNHGLEGLSRLLLESTKNKEKDF